MGIHIRIRKYDEHDGVFCYKIHGEDFGGSLFYMDIDTNNKKLKFYRQPNDTDIMYVIDLTKLSDTIPDIPGVVNGHILGYVFLKANNALKNNHFPEGIDLES